MSGFDRPIPAPVIAGGALLMSVAIGVTALAHGAKAHAPTPQVAVAQSRLIAVRHAPDGAITLAGLDGRTLRTLPGGGDGFLRGVMERIDFERAKLKIAGDPPIELVRWANGRLSVVDPATARDIPLDSFGRGNAADAASLLTERGA
ncbi:MAG: hypothetical protein INR64_03285 [Caulobacteraceae bacterium]|nr:hypothetical protein [Caulobacter sp.]